MIVDLWLNMFNYVIELLTRHLPTASFPAFVNEAISWLTDMWGVANFFIPMGTLALVLSLIVSLEIILGLFKLSIFVYKLLPGKAT